jgi:hypothetical protein
MIDMAQSPRQAKASGRSDTIAAARENPENFRHGIIPQANRSSDHSIPKYPMVGGKTAGLSFREGALAWMGFRH